MVSTSRAFAHGCWLRPSHWHMVNRWIPPNFHLPSKRKKFNNWLIQQSSGFDFHWNRERFLFPPGRRFPVMPIVSADKQCVRWLEAIFFYALLTGRTSRLYSLKMPKWKTPTSSLCAIDSNEEQAFVGLCFILGVFSTRSGEEKLMLERSRASTSAHCTVLLCVLLILHVAFLPNS